MNCWFSQSPRAAGPLGRHKAFPYLSFRGIVFIGLVALFGCAPDATAPGGTLPQQAVVAGGSAGEVITEHPTIPFADVEIFAAGSLRPGVPIVVTARLAGRVSATDVRFTLERLDLPAASRAANQGRSHATLRNWQGGLGVAASTSLESSITYDAPGYYRVLATATAAPVERLPDGTTVLNSASRVLWLLVTPEGGRLTNGWDSTVVDPAFRFEYGAYGVRFPRPRPRPAGTVEGLAMGSQATVQGSVKYHDFLLNQNVGIRGGQLSVVCFGRSSPEVLEWDLFEGPSVSTVSSNGDFTVVCPDGFEYAEGEYTMQGLVSVGKGKNGASVGSFLAAFTGTAGNLLLVNNDVAGSSFSIMEEFVPQAFTKFGRSRSSMLIWASDIYDDPDVDISYCHPDFGCSTEVVLMKNPGAFGEDGVFVVMHEYGHGYQYEGIEKWQLPTGCPNPHFPGTETTLTCALTEGFADFFSAWVGGSKIFQNQRYSDFRAEDNPDRMVGNGSIVEGAVSGFLYDLVDGPSDPNGPQNESGTDDDQVTWPGNLIVQVFQSCALRDASTGIWDTKLGGIDQFIYCLDTPDLSPPFDPQTAINPTTQQRYFATGRLYNQITVSATLPPTWDKAYFRQLWLFNLYNQGGL